MANKISVLIDVAVDQANRGIAGFKKAVGEADTAVGKMKAGASSAFGALKANAGMAAVAAGASIVAFGSKAVGEFTDLALEAGKLSDALGMPVEATSRLIEVAGDLGIEASTLESTIGRMNRTASSTPAAFDEIGAAIARNADGTINVEQTFLNTVDALNSMPDAAARAEAAQKIFGRSWQNMAELITTGADGITAAMAEVSEGKVIDEAEVQKARDYRAAMDRLGDAIDEISMVVGEQLAPALSQSAEQLAAMVEWAQKLKLIDLAGWVQDAMGPLDEVARVMAAASGEADIYGRTVHEVTAEQLEFVKAAKDAGLSADEVNSALALGVTTMDGYNDAQARMEHAAGLTSAALNTNVDDLGEVSDAADTTKSKIDRIRDAYDRLRGRLTDRAAWLSVQDGFADLGTSAQAAYDAAAAGAANAADLARDHEQAVIDQKLRVIEYAEQIGGIPPQKLTDIMALIDQGKLMEAAVALEWLSRPRQVELTPVMRGGGGSATLIPGSYGAEGGIVNRPTVALIGEAGPEAVVPLHKTRGNGPLPTSWGSSSGPSITVNVHGSLVTEQQVGKYIKQALDRFYANGGR